MEAMSSGLAPVAFTCPCGPKDIIRDGEDGILVANGDVEAFAKALIAMIQDDQMRERMAQNAHRNVMRYKMEEISRKWEFLFGQLLDK